MKVALVVLNWNGKKLLERFLPEMVQYSSEATVYVIDNNSTDDSIKYLMSEFPQVVRVETTENLGYAGGYNHGLKEIKEELLCLINNDIRVSKNWLAPVIELFNNKKEVALAQPHILDESKPTHFEYAGAAGGYVDRFGYPFCRGRVFDKLEEDKGQYDDNQSILWASGACFFVRNSVFKQLGGFDEDFFMHQEEIDFCWKAHNHGFKAYSIGGSKVYHLGGASLPSSPKKVFYNFRNSLYMLVKNVPGMQLPLVLFTRLLLDGVAGFRFILKGEIQNCFSILKAHAYFYANFYRMIKKRSSKQANSPYYLLNSITFQYFILKKSKFLNLKFKKS